MAKKRKSKVVRSFSKTKTLDAKVADSPIAQITSVTPHESKAEKSPFHIWKWIIATKKRSIPAAILAILIIILAVPLSRDVALGIFIKKNLSFIVQDDTSHARISD